MSDALQVFGHESADCDGCSLRERRDDGKCVPARPPANAFGGLMIIGEGPGRKEVLQGRPFVGRSGKLLDALLEAAEIDRDEVFISNATLCQPPVLKGESKPFHDRHPDAIPSCLGRLEAEIAQYRPRVVLAMGTSALIAATGYTNKKMVQVDNDCDQCDPKTRKVGPGLACAKGDCDWSELADLLEGVDPKDEAVAAWRDELIEQTGGTCPKCSANIKRLRPRMIKCPACGGKKKRLAEKLEWAFDYTVKEVAGGIFDAAQLASRWDEHGVKYVIPTFHPAFLLRPVDSSSTRKAYGGQFAAQAVLDHLEKARRLLERDHDFRFRVKLTDRAQDIYDYCAQPGLYSWDVETNGKSAWDVTDLRCVGIGRAGREEVLVVDTRGMVENVGTEDEHRFEVQRAELAEALRWFLTSPKHPKVAQNGPYDAIVVHRMLDVVVQPIGGDTKLAHHVLRPDEPHDLQMMAFEMTEAPHWKPPKKQGGLEQFRDAVELAVYNARDVRATALTHEVIAGHPLEEPAIKEMPTGVPVRRFTTGGRVALEGLRDVYDVDVEVSNIALEMERTGIPIDTVKLREVIEDTQPKRDALLVELTEWAGLEGFNPNSPPQLQYVLFDKAGPFKLTATAKTPTGQPSTAAEELAKLSDHPFVQKLLKFREYDKALGTYIFGKGMVPREDGRIHPSWNTTGARTGRWSSSPNFQNWPPWLREIVRAPDGWQILGADYSQLELRIMAALSGDPELIRRCMTADESDKTNPDKDPHAFVASVVFGEAFAEAEAEGRKVLRGIVKHCIYGMNYGAGPRKVHETIYKKGYDGPPLGVQQVKEIIEQIFRVFPGVKTWREETLRWSTKHEEVRSAVLNRWRTFPLGEVDATVAWNYPIQSTGGDIMNLRLIALSQRLARRGSRAQMMAQVHDAVYLLVPDEEVDDVKQEMDEELTTSLVLVEGAPPMDFVATAKAGVHWAEVA